MAEINAGEVKVYVWDTDSSKEAVKSGETGHAALAVKTMEGQFRYLSWYPTGSLFELSQARMPPGYGKSKSTVGEDGKRTFSDKVLNHGVPGKDVKQAEWPTRSAQHKAVFENNALNTEAIVSFIDRLTSGETTTSNLIPAKQYQLLLQNCSATVAHALKAGAEKAFADNPPPWPGHWVWSPDNVWVYTQQLKESVLIRKKSARISRGETKKPFIEKKHSKL